MKNQKKLNAPHFKIQCCHNCPKRTVRCHVTCRLYQGYRREGLRAKRAVHINNGIEDQRFMSKESRKKRRNGNI